jgi:nucleotidyltransferase substrate binding protein (TIGR01987 family)
MESGADIRWIQRFDNFKRAFAQLRRAAALAQERQLSELEQQGLIKAFEFSHELAWKTLKDFLELNGVTELYGSVKATRAAFAQGLIDNGEVWMEMIKSRNLSVYAYDQAAADQIAVAILASYLPELSKLEARLEAQKQEAP